MVLIFSPHFDDAVFSLGIMIQRLLVDNKVTVVTIFSDCRSQNQRQKENNRALLNFECESLELGFQDAPLRSKIYESPVSLLFNHKEDFLEQVKILKTSILDFIEKNDVKKIFAPIAVGEHIDHLITFEAIYSIQSSFKGEIFYYVDQPYDEIHNALNIRLQWISRGERHLKKFCQEIAMMPSFLHKVLSPEELLNLSSSQQFSRFDTEVKSSYCRYEVLGGKEEILKYRKALKEYESQQLFWPVGSEDEASLSKTEVYFELLKK